MNPSDLYRECYLKIVEIQALVFSKHLSTAQARTAAFPFVCSFVRSFSSLFMSYHACCLWGRRAAFTADRRWN